MMEQLSEAKPESESNDLKPVYAVFCDAISQESTGRIFNSITLATQRRLNPVHLLFQSAGGTVGDGVCLYNFFRSIPLDLHIYNVGQCGSAGAVAFLGAKYRHTSAYATFMLHRTTAGAQMATAGLLHGITQSVRLDDMRIEAILKNNLTLSDAQWGQHQISDLWLSADEAVECGMVSDILDFAPPTGMSVYNI